MSPNLYVSLLPSSVFSHVFFNIRFDFFIFFILYQLLWNNSWQYYSIHEEFLICSFLKRLFLTFLLKCFFTYLKYIRIYLLKILDLLIQLLYVFRPELIKINGFYRRFIKPQNSFLAMKDGWWFLLKLKYGMVIVFASQNIEICVFKFIGIQLRSPSQVTQSQHSILNRKEK